MGNQKGSPKGKYSFPQMIKGLPLCLTPTLPGSVLPFLESKPTLLIHLEIWHAVVLEIKALEAQNQMKQASGFKPLTSAQYSSQLGSPG